MAKSRKKIKWSRRGSKKCRKLIQNLATEVQTPATMHCFEVSEEFDTEFWEVYGKENKFRTNFESYIGILSFTAFNESTTKGKKKKRIGAQKERSMLMSILLGIGRFCQSCIVTV
jgi:hypothetical protein